MIKLGDEYYLGNLCPEGHKYESTRQTLRDKFSHCQECQKIAQRKYDGTKRDPVYKHMATIKARCKRLGVNFSLPIDWLYKNTPETCPVLNIPLVRGSHKDSKDNFPSVDRLVPKLGYTPENCRVISNRANQIKSNASVEELRSIADWTEKELTDPLFTDYYKRENNNAVGLNQ